jgi:hypothetical protein
MQARLKLIWLQVLEQFCVPVNVVGSERRRMLKEKILEAIGSILGMGGAAWLALKVEGYSYAYVPFLLSSIAMTRQFYLTRQGWFMLQQSVFMVINLAGVYCWIVK